MPVRKSASRREVVLATLVGWFGWWIGAEWMRTSPLDQLRHARTAVFTSRHSETLLLPEVHARVVPSDQRRPPAVSRQVF